MKKKECVVHIGMHKTGSSSIQESLHRQLEAETHHYCDLNSPNHSIPIFSLFSIVKISDAQKKMGLSRNDIDKFNLDTKNMLIQNINLCNKSMMIISGEGITRLAEIELEGLRDFLNQYFEKITIVGYVRTMKSYMESAFQQRVKGGLGNLNLENLCAKYRDIFEKYDVVFGKDNVKLWKFEPKKFPEGNVVLDFCSRLGIMMKSEETIRVNESLSKEALSLLYIYRKYGPGYGIGADVIRENNNIINVLKDTGKTKVKFSPFFLKPVIEKHKEDILWMEDRLGEVLTESMRPSINDIGCEEDLLAVDDELLRKLCDLVGYNALSKGESSDRVQEVVDLIQALRIKLAKNTKKNNIKKRNDEMKMIELAQKVQKDNTEQLGKINEKKIAMIIRRALEQIKIEIENTEDGKINVQGFGNFFARMIEKEEEGSKVMLKRITFRPAKNTAK